jgi:hypothetical protein
LATHWAAPAFRLASRRKTSRRHSIKRQMRKIGNLSNNGITRINWHSHLVTGSNLLQLWYAALKRSEFVIKHKPIQTLGR